MKAFLIAILLFGIWSPAHASSIEIYTSQRILIFRDSNGVRNYDIAVGKPSAQWFGKAVVVSTKTNPSWTPTPNQRRKNLNLPRTVAPGPKNPLGSAAIYLNRRLYRIHGTNQPTSIGRAASSGCFRMRNSDILELQRLVKLGTTVTVYR